MTDAMLTRIRHRLVGVWLLGGLLLACGPGNLASHVATPPEFAPKDQAKCSVKKSQMRPLIVEWPSADRGELEAHARRRGLVVVRYEGCEMQVLNACAAPVSYSYAPITRKKDRLAIHDADELYANIPIGAVKLESKLEKAGELDVDMMMVGRWEADRVAIRSTDLDGDCKGATHVVSAMSVGAFTFAAGAEAGISGGASALGAGGGGKSTSKRETLNADGDESACAKSADGDRTPPDGCGAILRLEVAPLVDAAPTAESSKPASKSASAVTSTAPLRSVAIPPGVESSSMDPSVSPCDDFYTYACGGWMASHPLPDDKTTVGRFAEVGDANAVAVRAILERDATSPPSNQPYARELGTFYSACMNEAAIEKAGAHPLDAELARIRAINDAPSLARVLARLHAIGVHALFSVGSDVELGNAAQTIVTIDQDGLGVPNRDWYFGNDATRTTYQKHVERAFALLGDDQATASSNAAVVLGLETELAQASLRPADRRDPKNINHPMSRADFEKLAPGIAWSAYLGEVGLGSVARLNAAVPSYLTAVERIVSGSEGLRRAQTYLRWQLFRAFASTLGARFVDETLAFRRDLFQTNNVEPRWRRCVAAADKAMGDAIGQVFAASRLGEDGKTATRNIERAVQEELEARIGRSTWMDAPTRGRAIEKLHAVRSEIGYPEVWRRYDGLVLDRSSFTTNVMRTTELEFRRDLARVGKATDRNAWAMTQATVNAYYDPQGNSLVFPSGVLQPPFFSRAAAAPTNFGAIGMIFGHELSHGFDDEGRLFDKTGALGEWWSASTADEYHRRAQCIVDQYNGYVGAGGGHVDGKLTLGENAADLAGVQLALGAMRRSGIPQNFESDRQFFIGYAQQWCSVMREDAAKVRLKTDPHAPVKWRVNGSLSNVPEFAAAFACSERSTMARSGANRCSVW